MTIAIVRRATAEDGEVLGIIGPAAYAEAYGYLWDRPDAYCDQLRTFGPQAFESLLARPEARVWIGEAGGTIVGFLSMIVGSVDPIERRPGGAEIPRIYIIGPAQRTGLGRLLVDAAIRQWRLRVCVTFGSTLWHQPRRRGAPTPNGVFERLADAGSKSPSGLPYPTWLF
jgi:GNAT superfamily N-acetyltransferase